MKKVYIVTEGGYEPVNLAAFSTREHAEAFVEKYNDAHSARGCDTPVIQEWGVDEQVDLVIRPCWSVCFSLEGGKVIPRSDGRLSILGSDLAHPHQRVGPSDEIGWWARGFWATSFVSENHAIEVAREIYREWLANREQGKGSVGEQ